MRYYIQQAFGLLLCFFWSTGSAQNIKGQVIELADKQPMSDVIIHNVHTGASISSNKNGDFIITASTGQLLEFKKTGYKTTRMHLPGGNMPPFFKIGLEKEKPEPELATGRAKTYKEDSLRYHELYKHELDFAKLNGMEAIAHPFSAMSKRNQQIWAFQDEYAANQEQKYINYLFNDSLVNNLTGLADDSLQSYMRMFRPSYTQLRSMNEYSYYVFIKRTVDAYRKRGPRARQSLERNSR